LLSHRIPCDDLPVIAIEWSLHIFPRQSPIAAVDSQNCSLLAVVTLDFGQNEERGLSACTLVGPQQLQPIFPQQTATQWRSGDALGPVPVAGRRNEMVAKMAKELLRAFRLFESLSNPGKHRMRAIKRMSSSSDQVPQIPQV
jgi:hypothetical protein